MFVLTQTAKAVKGSNDLFTGLFLFIVLIISIILLVKNKEG